MPKVLKVARCVHCKGELPASTPRSCPHCGGSLQQRFLSCGCLSSAPALLLLGAGIWLALSVL